MSSHSNTTPSQRTPLSQTPSIGTASQQHERQAQEALNARSRRLDDREHDLDARLDDLTFQEAHLNEREARLNRHAQQQEARAAQLWQREAVLEEREEMLRDREAAIEERDLLNQFNAFDISDSGEPHMYVLHDCLTSLTPASSTAQSSESTFDDDDCPATPVQHESQDYH